MNACGSLWSCITNLLTVSVRLPLAMSEHLPSQAFFVFAVHLACFLELRLDFVDVILLRVQLRDKSVGRHSVTAFSSSDNVWSDERV